MTLYDEIKAAGIEHDNHASDLYLPNTPTVQEILKRHKNYHRSYFTNQRNGESWIDVSFAFMPFWDNVSKLSRELDAARMPNGSRQSDYALVS